MVVCASDDIGPSNHPVTNEYVPKQFRHSVFLRKAGDLSSKITDEDMLRACQDSAGGGIQWKDVGRTKFSYLLEDSTFCYHILFIIGVFIELVPNMYICQKYHPMHPILSRFAFDVTNGQI